MTSHAALVSNAVLYFPDVMNGIMKKNPEFGDNVKWTLEFCSEMDIINDPTLQKLFHLVSINLAFIAFGVWHQINIYVASAGKAGNRYSSQRS